MKKILIVDDSEFNLLLVTTMLHDDYDVDTALSGQDALKKIENKLFHLIILDVVMEKISGFDLCKELRENPKTKHTPIIFLTATDQTLAEKGYKAGADEFLGKPIKSKKLKEKIKKLLQRPII